jgi:phosphoribosyl 1,2-cyclic phosphodiesterase
MTTAELRQRLKTALTQSQGIDLSDPAAIERHIERLPTHVNTVISGNTSCVELRVNDQRFILDMGSGLKLLGEAMMQERFTGQMHIFMSHLHLDHIEGYPFFVPAFIPGNHLHFYSPRDGLEKHLRAFMDAPYFPVDLDYQAAQKSFHTLDIEEELTIAGVSVRLLELDHPGKAYAYRFSFGGKTLVYASDGEYPNMDHDHTAKYEDFFRDADVLIFDAMYTYEDAVTSKMHWGHSTARAGAELAWRAGVKQLILTHHDPLSPAQELWARMTDAEHHLRYRMARDGLTSEAPPVRVMLAYEGLTLEL